MGPSGRKPNAEEQRWIDAIMEFGCVACYLDGFPECPAALHHIVECGRRLGHRWSLPLCDPGHHQNGQARGKVPLHPGKSRQFIALYGTERELLARLERKLGFDHIGGPPP